MDSESIAERITQFFGGVFLFFFGLPFTLVPFLILGEFRGMDAGLSETIFSDSFRNTVLFGGTLSSIYGSECHVWVD